VRAFLAHDQPHPRRPTEKVEGVGELGDAHRRAAGGLASPIPASLRWPEPAMRDARHLLRGEVSRACFPPLRRACPHTTAWPFVWSGEWPNLLSPVRLPQAVARLVQWPQQGGQTALLAAEGMAPLTDRCSDLGKPMDCENGSHGLHVFGVPALEGGSPECYILQR
jgi:hypothetical protein